MDFERDDPYPYDELAARFGCPWLREAPNEEDQGTISLVGTILCTVELE